MNTKIKLSVSEAAKLFAISQRTIRRAIVNNDIEYSFDKNRYQLDFTSLIKWSESSSTLKRKRDSQGIGQFIREWNI